MTGPCTSCGGLGCRVCGFAEEPPRLHLVPPLQPKPRLMPWELLGLNRLVDIIRQLVAVAWGMRRVMQDPSPLLEFLEGELDDADRMDAATGVDAGGVA